jgi:hypothetical protein
VLHLAAALPSHCCCGVLPRDAAACPLPAIPLWHSCSLLHSAGALLHFPACRGKPKIVDLTSQRRLADRVTEAYLACGEAERDEYLYCLLAKHPGG